MLFIWQILVRIGLMNSHGQKVNSCTAKCSIYRRLDPLGVVSVNGKEQSLLDTF